MDPSKLTSYRDAARVAAKLADFYKDFAGLTVGMQMLIGNDIPTLATAVDELVAEVERLTAERSSLAKALQVVADMQWKRGYIRHQRSEAIEAEKILNDFLKVTHDDR